MCLTRKEVCAPQALEELTADVLVIELFFVQFVCILIVERHSFEIAFSTLQGKQGTSTSCLNLVQYDSKFFCDSDLFNKQHSLAIHESI